MPDLSSQILVVDDIANNLFRLQAVLEAKGYDVPDPAQITDIVLAPVSS